MMRDSARRILEENSPGVILLEEDTVAGDAEHTREAAPTLESVVAPLAVHAPVVVIGPAEKRGELAGLIEAGVADFVERKTNAIAEARGLIQRRLRQANQEATSAQDAPENSEENGEEDFGEVLRHELNNPPTGILGNAELLLAEIRRKKEVKFPAAGSSGSKRLPRWRCACGRRYGG
jgi:signal transduction histidine kinase